MNDDPRVEAAHAVLKAIGCSQSLCTEALAAADQAAWRPISEAPKDETPVLIWGPATSHAMGPVEHHTPTMCVAAFRGGLWVGASVSYLNWHPTHFMPLPVPPEGDDDVS